MSSSTKLDNRKKDILILGKGPTLGLEHTLSAEKMYSINCAEPSKKFCLKLHYNGANSYLFINGKEIYKFKAKDSEIVTTPLCLGNISKDWSVDNMKKNWIKPMSVILVLTIGQFPLLVYKTFIYIWWLKLVCCKMFGFIKKCFFTGLTFLLTLTSVQSLSCISMNNQECKNLCFFLLVLKQVNAVVVLTISIIRMQNCAFLMLLKS